MRFWPAGDVPPEQQIISLYLLLRLDCIAPSCKDDTQENQWHEVEIPASETICMAPTQDAAYCDTDKKISMTPKSNHKTSMAPCKDEHTEYHAFLDFLETIGVEKEVTEKISNGEFVESPSEPSQPSEHQININMSESVTFLESEVETGVKSPLDICGDNSEFLHESYDNHISCTTPPLPQTHPDTPMPPMKDEACYLLIHNNNKSTFTHCVPDAACPEAKKDPSCDEFFQMAIRTRANLPHLGEVHAPPLMILDEAEIIWQNELGQIYPSKPNVPSIFQPTRMPMRTGSQMDMYNAVLQADNSISQHESHTHMLHKDGACNPVSNHNSIHMHDDLNSEDSSSPLGCVFVGARASAGDFDQFGSPVSSAQSMNGNSKHDSDRYKFKCLTPLTSDDEDEHVDWNKSFFRPVSIASGMKPAPLVGHLAHGTKCIKTDGASNPSSPHTPIHKNMMLHEQEHANAYPAALSRELPHGEVTLECADEAEDGAPLFDAQGISDTPLFDSDGALAECFSDCLSDCLTDCLNAQQESVPSCLQSQGRRLSAGAELPNSPPNTGDLP